MKTEDGPIFGVSPHARERMRERYGRDGTPDQWRQLVLDIIDRRAVLLRSKAHTDGEIWLGKLGSIALRVVWVPSMGFIATVLPLHDKAEGAPQSSFRSRNGHQIRRAPWLAK